MAQGRIPIIGKKGFTSTHPASASLPRTIQRVNPRGQSEVFCLVNIDGPPTGIAYVSASKTYAWACRQLIARQIVPFDWRSVPHVTLQAATDQFQDTITKVQAVLERSVAAAERSMPKVNDEAFLAAQAEITRMLREGEKPKPAINNIHREAVDQFRFLNEYSVEFNSLDRYQQIATESAIYPGRGTPFGLMYAALGLAEAGEVQNKVKKAFRDDGVIEFVGNDDEQVHHVKFAPVTAERREQIKKELGGALWYIAAVCNELDLEMSEVALANLEELLGRTERGTLSGSGDNR